MKGNIALLMPAVAKEMAGKGEDDDEAESEGESPSSEPSEEMTAAAGTAASALGIKLDDAKKVEFAKALKLFLYCCEEE